MSFAFVFRVKKREVCRHGQPNLRENVERRAMLNCEPFCRMCLVGMLCTTCPDLGAYTQ
jgi:hypothetical protein